MLGGYERSQSRGLRLEAKNSPRIQTPKACGARALALAPRTLLAMRYGLVEVLAEGNDSMPTQRRWIS